MLSSGKWTPRACALLLAISFLSSSPARAQRPTSGYNSPTRTTDGSLKLALEFAGGYNVATGTMRPTADRGWDILAGAGCNINYLVGVLGEFTFDHFTVPGTALAAAGSTAGPGGLHADTRLWSIGGSPVLHYFTTDHWGGYVIGGPGMYFRYSMLGENGGCNQGSTTNCYLKDGSALDTRHAPGFSLGTGLAWRVSDNSNAKAFAEFRYVRTGKIQDSFQGNQSLALTFLPVRAGIRW